MSVLTPTHKILFGDTAAVGTVVSGNSGYIIQEPYEAVSRFIEAQESEGQLFALLTARYDGAAGAFLSRVDLETGEMIWGHTYGPRTGFPIFTPHSIIVGDTVVSLLGFFPINRFDGNPPSEGNIAAGWFDGYVGRIDVSRSDGSLVASTILADSTVFERPASRSQSQCIVGNETVEVYSQITFDDRFTVIRYSSSGVEAPTVIDTVHTNWDISVDLPLSVRRSGTSHKIALVKDELFFLNMLVNPEGESYARLLHYNDQLDLVDSISLDVDFDQLETMFLYAVRDSLLKIVPSTKDVNSDQNKTMLYSTNLELIATVDDVATVEQRDGFSGVGQRSHLWPYFLEGVPIFTASDFSSAFEDSRYYWYQLGQNYEPQVFLRELVDPDWHEINTQDFIDLSGDRLGLFMRQRCDYEGVFSDDFFQLWVYDKADVVAHFLPTSTEEEWITTSEDNLKLYPNPASDALFIKELEDGTALQVVSMTGIHMLDVRLDQGRVDISSLPSGIYSIQSPQHGSVGRFVKID